MRLSRKLTVALFATLASGASYAMAQEAYPVRPITIVNPLPPGGTTDLISRALAPLLEARLGQPVVVENRDGAAGAVGTAAVANSAADGYTLLLTQASFLLIPAADEVLGREPAFSPDQFEAISRFTADPIIAAVQSSSPITDVEELIDELHARPGQMTYSSSGIYGPLHVPMEMFLSGADAQMRHVPTNGGGPAITALLGGHVDIGTMVVAGAIAQTDAGLIRPLVVLGAERNPAFPEVPSSTELGYPVDFAVWTGLFAPTGTPEEVLNRLADEVAAVTSSPDFLQTMENAGTQLMILGRDDFAEYLVQQASDVDEALSSIASGGGQ